MSRPDKTSLRELSPLVRSEWWCRDTGYSSGKGGYCRCLEENGPGPRAGARRQSC